VPPTKLTTHVKAGGCASKLSPKILDHVLPRRTTRVGGVERPLKLYALSSDANSDCTVNSDGWRTISGLEATGMPNPFFVTALFEAMLNYMGTTMALEIAPGQCSSSSHLVNCVRGVLPPTSSPSCGDNHTFLLNDFIVTTDSQAYKSNQGAFLPLTNPSPDQYPSRGGQSQFGSERPDRTVHRKQSEADHAPIGIWGVC
jgi:hypothetical protein